MTWASAYAACALASIGRYISVQVLSQAGVSARDLESSRPRRASVQGAADGIQAAGRRSAQAMRGGVDLGLEGFNRAGRGIRDGYNDGAISIAMDRRVSDGAVVSTSFDVHIPQRGAGVFHLALASLPVSTIVSLKLRVGDQSPLR